MSAFVSIRKASLSDSPKIAELCGVLGYPVGAEVMAERLARVIDRPEDTVLVAVLASGRIVGWLHASERQLLEMGRYAEILGLVVDESHRSFGAGRELVASAEAWARARGLADLHVRSNIVRIESHPFYERLGFVRVKTQHAYRKALASEG
jgi:N-acetylglutamate synthase-like GNAT family acetyltransferase